METKFKTRTKSRTDKYIQLQFNEGTNRYVFSSPYSVANKEWAAGYPKAISTTKQLRENLNKAKAKLDNFIAEVITAKERNPTKNELQSKINEVFGKEQTVSLKSVYAQYKASKASRVEASTIQQIDTTFDLLFTFNNKVEFADINQLMGSKFTAYLSKQGYAAVTINKHHKNIKAFLNWCYEMDFTSANLSKYFKNKEAKEKTIIAITEQELNTIEQAILTPRLDKIRDLFLMACYTGLRFSDVTRVTAQMLHNGELHLTQKKTKSPVQIPVLTGANRLLTKYNGVMPSISNQKANVYLKDLFAHLKLNRLVFNDETATHEPLSKAITFHIARKSFITIALSRGVNAKVVQAISGHKKDSVFNKYIAFSSNTRISELSKMENNIAPLQIVK